jgi:chromosomal replication initiator protein
MTNVKPEVPFIGDLPFPIGDYKSSRDDAWKILEHVCKLRSVPVAMVLSDRRTRPFALARHHVWAAISDSIPSMSSSRIARLFSRDHTTILYGIKQHKKRLENAP